MSQDIQQSKFRNFISRDPTGKEVQRYDFETDEKILQKIQKGSVAFQTLRNLSFEEKRQKLLKLAEVLEKYEQEDAKLISQEIGKPYDQALLEVKKSIGHCRFYADTMSEFLKPKQYEVMGQKQQVFHEPLGVVYLITPFNFPHWQIFKPAIANIALGNSLIVRTSDSTPQTGLTIEKRFQQAGFEDIYQNVFSTPAQLELILSNKFIKGVSFTGSSGAGSFIASLAGKYLKKAVMELGGSDPFIVLKDSDIELAASLAIKARLLNCGQVCIASKRFIINDNIYDEFVTKIISKVKELKIGYPLEDGVFLGPMSRLDLLENIERQVNESIKQGGKLLYGGKRLTERPGNFYEPTVIEVQKLDNVLFKEEVFGPVFALHKFSTDEEAISIANDTEYGLGGVVIGKDEIYAEKIARQLECGMSFVNEISKSDSKLPCGGMKRSGFGRECGEFGITEFSNIRLVWVTANK